MIIALRYRLFQNISIAVVGKNEKFHILSDAENNEYVSAIERRPAPGAAAEPETPAPGPSPDGPPGPGDRDPQVAVAMEFH